MIKFFLIFKSSITSLTVIFITYYYLSNKKDLIFNAKFIYIFYHFLWLCFVSLILYLGVSNIYCRLLMCFFCICYQFCTFKNPIFTTHFYLGVWPLPWLLSPPFDSLFSPPGHLYVLPHPFLPYPICESLCVFQAMENTLGTDYRLDLSLSFWFPLFLSWSPLSTSSFSSLCNCMSLSEGSRLWRAHRELITG